MDLAIAGDCDRQMVRECLQTPRTRRALEALKLIPVADILLIPEDISSRITIGGITPVPPGHGNDQVEVSVF
jgi:hypothetical protein